MTKQEKQLLLKDLCARLPYNVIVKISHRIVDSKTGKVIKEECHDKTLSLWNEDLLHEAMSNIKPYLRPISSMTEAERRTYTTLRAHALPFTIVAWLDENMFDHRTNSEGEHLIESGLALEAPEGMYK
jgi:hypothetical protein